MRTLHPVLLKLLIVVCFTSFCFIEARKQEPENGRERAEYTIIAFVPDDSDAIESKVSDLNETGQAVGWIVASDRTTRGLHLEIPSGKYTLLSGENSTADGVNNLNQIAGRIQNRGAFWATPDAEPVPLAPLPGHVRSWASHINDAGLVIGHSYDHSRTAVVPVIWHVSLSSSGVPDVGGPWLLESLTKDTYARAVSLNEAVNGTAQVVGWSYDDALERAVTWTVSLNEKDGTLKPGPPVGFNTLGLQYPSWSRGAAVNDAGIVCGVSDHHPFRTATHSGLHPLPAPQEMYRGHPHAINDGGEIVGWVDFYSEGESVVIDLRAYLWRENEAVELNKEIDPNSGWHNLRVATCINQAGVIGGYGQLNENLCGFLLIPKE